MYSEKPKICHLTTVHPPFDTRIFHKEAKSLAKAGYSVTLIARHDKEEIIDGVKIIPLKAPRNRIVRMTKTLLECYHKAVKVDADLYHFHDPELIFVGWLLKKKGKKVIYDVHEDYFATIKTKFWIPRIFRSIIYKIYVLLDSKIVKKFDGIISAWPRIHEHYINNSIYSTLVRNYPDLKINKIIKSNKSNKIAYIGGISEERGIKEIIKALEILPKSLNVMLELCGSFNSKKLEEEIILSSGWRRVNYHGWVNQKEANKIINECIAGLIIFHPIQNHLYSQPNKIFEYMAAGLPVICSNLPMLKSIVDNVHCGILVNPLNTVEICNAIIYVLENKDIAESMGTKGRSAVETLYNWEKEKYNLLSLYDYIFQNL
jgi:glycosyltransferase involved in cell wall biosynthesis